MSRTLEPYQMIERSIIRKFRDALWKPFVYAVKKYELIQAGDRIAVCISGGKDSMLMAKLMQELPRIAQESPAACQAIREVLDDSARWLNGTSGGALLQEALDRSADFCLEGAAGALARKPVLCIAGTLDTYTPPAWHCEPLIRAVGVEGGTALRTIRYPTDHFFADYRLTVAEAVTAFLKEQLAE